MGNELDKQDEVLDRIDRKADNALDHIDNINIQLKKTLEGVLRTILNANL